MTTQIEQVCTASCLYIIYNDTFILILFQILLFRYARYILYTKKSNAI